MLHFMDNQNGQGSQNDTGNDLVARIMAAEYNLAVQRQGADAATPMGILGQMLGELLQERAAR